MEKEHPLPKPKFTDMERAAWDWLFKNNIRPWVVDLLTKKVRTPKEEYDDLVCYAIKLGWNKK